MTEEQIIKLKKLSELKESYEKFIEKEGNVGISYYSPVFKEILSVTVYDVEFMIFYLL